MPCGDALAAQQGFAAQPGRVLGGDGGLVPDAVHQLRLQGCSPQLRQQVGHAKVGTQAALYGLVLQVCLLLQPAAVFMAGSS